MCENKRKMRRLGNDRRACVGGEGRRDGETREKAAVLTVEMDK